MDGTNSTTRPTSAATRGAATTRRDQCPQESSFPTTAPPTRTTRSPSDACSARAGAEVSLAYVRHNPETDSVREEIAQAEAESCSPAALELLGTPNAKRYVVDRPLDAAGARCARRARGRRGDRVLLGLPHGQGARGGRQLRRAAARGRAHRDRDRARRTSPSGSSGSGSTGSSPSATPTEARVRPPRRSRAALGATVAPVANDEADLIVIDSRADAEPGQRLDELLRVAPDRDGHRPGAGPAARGDAGFQRRRRRRAGGRVGRSEQRGRATGPSERTGREPARAESGRAPRGGRASRPARCPSGPVQSQASARRLRW